MYGAVGETRTRMGLRPPPPQDEDCGFRRFLLFDFIRFFGFLPLYGSGKFRSLVSIYVSKPGFLGLQDILFSDGDPSQQRVFQQS